jgi:uncharacterized protein YdhG (YjbR/CyaY superfamily)
MPEKKSPGEPASKRAATQRLAGKFTEEEQAAMRERAKELKAAARCGKRAGKVDDEQAVLARIADMPASDRALAERLHTIIRACAPTLSPKLWYGMPAYAKDGEVLCFFQSGHKFKTRYATFGFLQEARLDDGSMWPTAFALTALTAADEVRITALLQKAVS